MTLILFYSLSCCISDTDIILFSARCVSDCTDKPNGDYQSCEGCNVYVTCSNGILHPNRPCPANLVWDDNLKRCEWTSTTCGQSFILLAQNVKLL